MKLGLAYSVRGLLHYQPGRQHGGPKADMVLEKEARVLHLAFQAVGREPLGLAWASETPKPYPQ